MPWNLICAWLVHLYTGLGVVVGFLSLLQIEQRDFRFGAGHRMRYFRQIFCPLDNPRGSGV